jgi:hypothetical protein
MNKRLVALLVGVLFLSSPILAQVKWYKFSKQFVQQHFGQDGSAIGSIRVTEMHAAKNVHPIDCGGNDGELHIGVPGAAIASVPVSALAADGNNGFGMVAEPPNVKRGSSFFNNVESADGKAGAFYGYFRAWNEGHDVGALYPSNPHHVLEVHPAWAVRSAAFTYGQTPAVIFPMQGFSGYGASKFHPLLDGVANWLRVAEDDQFVYVRMIKAENFYQLPVVVKQVRQIGNGAGVAALVDVYSDVDHQNLAYSNLTVIAAANSQIAARLHPDWSTYLLGFFSINLSKAMAIAAGHEGIRAGVAAPGALEFFAFGVPLQHAVSQSKPCTEEDD